MFTTNVALLIAIELVISFFYALICDQYHELQIDYFVQHFHLIMNIAQLGKSLESHDRHLQP